jgi:hypothetical protein
MLEYKLRFFNHETKEMVYDCGISPNQKPLRKLENGLYEELEGDYTPMINTGQKALNGVISEADILDCQAKLNIAGLETLLQVRGVMQFDPNRGAFMINIIDAPKILLGKQFEVQDANIIGNAFLNKELITKNYEKKNESSG